MRQLTRGLSRCVVVPVTVDGEKAATKPQAAKKSDPKGLWSLASRAIPGRRGREARFALVALWTSVPDVPRHLIDGPARLTVDRFQSSEMHSVGPLDFGGKHG